MKTKLYLIFGLLSSCNFSAKNDSEDGKFFVRDNFKSTTKLTGQVMNFNASLHPLNYTIIKDTLLFVTNWEGKPFYVEVYNLKSMQNICSIARRGKGPNEFLSCDLNYRTNDTNYFYIYDIVKQCVAKFDIDSVLAKGELYAPQQIKLPRYTNDVAFADQEEIIGYNNSYFEKGKLTNNVKQIFTLSEARNANDSIVDVAHFKYLSANVKYFSANVSGGYILVAPSEDKIWVVNRYTDKIDIYNKRLEFSKSLVGPDIIKPEYKIHDNQISFKGKYYRAYMSGFFTKAAVYLIYIGVDGVPNDKNYRKPVEIFKFSWAGELLYRYELDKYLFTISIDKDEKRLYGTHFNSPREYPQLIRYDLPD